MKKQRLEIILAGVGYRTMESGTELQRVVLDPVIDRFIEFRRNNKK